jgi:hypothetical protein
MGLFFAEDSTQTLIGYANAGYLLDPDDAKSQTNYVILYGNTTISWKSTKQNLACNSSNHAEIVALHEASQGCIWPRCIMDYIHVQCGLLVLTNPIVLFKNNFTCVEQVSKGFIKGDQIKHIAPNSSSPMNNMTMPLSRKTTMQIYLPNHFPSSTSMSLPSPRPQKTIQTNRTNKYLADGCTFPLARV